MEKKNPYAISFGRIPNQYISRDALIDDIIENFDSDIVTEQAYKLTGIRGTGKTVTLTAIEKELRSREEWIVADVKPGGEIICDIVSQLYGEVPFLREMIDINFNLSVYGIGLDVSGEKPALSLDVVLKKLLTEIKKRNKRVLVVIDEVQNTPALVDFIQEFQILIRSELPIYLIVAGLYEDIECIENSDGLTFFLRAEKCEMTPLNITIIREDYKRVLGLDHDTADRMARMTKGYAFAFQAFGKYMWESGDKELTPYVLACVDEALSQKVYKKIWSELRKTDKWFLKFIVEHDAISASELLKITGKSHREWSEPRRRLIEKGIIDGSVRGQVSVKLPRFKEFVEEQLDM